MPAATIIAAIIKRIIFFFILIPLRENRRLAEGYG